MPFVKRVVTPKYLSRVSLHDDAGRPRVKDDELDAVTNFTLCSALRQLASVVQLAGDIFLELENELTTVTERGAKLKTRLSSVEQKVKAYDPKNVPVPESDLTEFWARNDHFKCQEDKTTCLFTPNSRPKCVQNLYEAAASPPKALRRSGSVYNITPVLGPKKKHAVSEIESRKPALVNELRRWTSSEVLGSITVDPDCTLKVPTSLSDGITDHTLPSPEEQVQAIANKFPPEVVAVDVSGKNFDRMSSLRRSLVSGDFNDIVKRRTGKRRPRGKRRNTIAGTDVKELAAIVGDSSDVGKTTPESVVLEKKSHLEHLKEWGRSRLRQIKNYEPTVRLRNSSAGGRRKIDKEDACPHSSSGNWSQSSESGHSTATSHVPRSSISSGSGCPKHKKMNFISASSSVTSESTTVTPDDGETCSTYSCDTEGYYTSFHLDSGLKTLREEEPCPPAYSTSALSVNSHNTSTLTAESEYELFGKGSTSTTASSAGTVCTTLLIPRAPSVPERVSSQLSGNKTLPERTAKSHFDTRETQSLKFNKKPDMQMSFEEVKQINMPSQSILTQENVSKHDTNDSSETKNCIITVDVHHRKPPEKCGDSPDSGHNTCSSPVDSIASPSLDLEMSECSDLEGVDRVERLREKTTINSSRIPSMCVITPPQSDDEASLNQYAKSVDSGEYVTIAEVKKPVLSPVKYSTIGPALKRDAEYVSLSDLPRNEVMTEPRRTGARVTLNAEGKVVYSSDSLRRRKSINTTGTFEPGPCVSNNSSPVPKRHVNINPLNSPLFANRKTITPTPVRKTNNEPPLKETNLMKEPSPVLSANRNIPSQTLNNQLNYQIQTFPLHNPKLINTDRPLSPLVSPTKTRSRTPVINRASSPRMIVKATTGGRPLSPVAARGAYVNINQPSEDDKNILVKRSDSYRMANDQAVFNPNIMGRKQYGASVVAAPSLLSAMQAARKTKEAAEESNGGVSPPRGGGSPLNTRGYNSGPDDRGGQSTWPRSTSTPTKSDSSSSLMNVTNLPSPIQLSGSSPKTSRSAMDLYAVIHESKKRIQNLQKPVPVWPKAIPAKSVSPIPQIEPGLLRGIPQPMPPLSNINQSRYIKQTNVGYASLPRLQVQKLEESPRNLQRRRFPPNDNSQSHGSPQLNERRSLASDRHGPSQPTSRNDFKRLLLQTGWSGSTGSNESAVQRLKGRATAQVKPINYDVLSSTIPEDRSDEDEQTESDSRISSTRTAKPFNPTLETAL